MSEMDWRQYEREIEKEFREAYPSAQITPNAHVTGKFSKVGRQIDLLIEEQAADFSFRIVVDAKHRGRKIDVTDVEAFMGLVRDVEAHTGVMVALEGYTPAAINRAHHDDLDLILDVLNFDELQEYQGRAAIPYSGENGVSIAAPLGWVVDATKRHDAVAWLYQRGVTFDEAFNNKEVMYVGFWNKKDKQINTLDMLLEYQKEYMTKDVPEAEIQLLGGVKGQRVGARTLIRRFKKMRDSPLEFTGFIDFENFIFMCVLFTPPELERKNLRKLRFVIRDAFPIKVTYDHTHAIAKAREQLREQPAADKRASLLCQIGCWQREMGQLQDAKRSLEESLSLVQNNHKGLTQLFLVLMGLGDKGGTLNLIRRMLRIDPHNPTVFRECFNYTGEVGVTVPDLLELFATLKTDYAEDALVQANCDFYAGQMLKGSNVELAKKHLLSARANFERVFPREHYVFDILRSVLGQLPN